MPPTNSLPIKHLPVEGGGACTHRKCNHLCVTVKRMKRHWGTAHGITGVEDVNWSPVKLRTFFRGKELLYFIVDAAGKDDSSSYNYLCYEPPSVTKYPATRTCQTTKLLSVSNSEHVDKVLFDHHTNVTFKTLVQRDEDPELWRTNVIQIAQSHPFVMHGLLAISALHLAWLNPNNGHENIILATIHQERALPI